MSTRQVAQTVRIGGDRRVVERLHDGLVLALEFGQAVVEHGPRVASTTRYTSGRAVDARPITNGPRGAIRSGCRRRRALLARAGLGITALEPLHTATRVDQLLLTREEGMALVAELEVDFGLGRPGGERVAARAAHRGLGVVGVDVSLHGISRSGSVSASTDGRIAADRVYRTRPTARSPVVRERSVRVPPAARRPGEGQVAGPLAISARNSSLLLVVRILSINSSRPAAALPSLARAFSTLRSFHTCWSWERSNSSSSCRVELALTSIDG